MEKQTDHRISLEKKVIGSDTTRSTWGLVAGFVVAMTGLGISYYLIATGNGVDVAHRHGPSRGVSVEFVPSHGFVNTGRA